MACRSPGCSLPRTLKHNEHVSVSASHELVEMLVDPSINLVAMHPRSKLIYGYESADPVE